MLSFGSLFSGIGGIDLGLERAGFQCAWQVEIDDYANRVLEKHWPSVKRFRDVRECGIHNLKPVELVAGGFPCQDISNAGRRAGIQGARSGLWSEFARIISELRPRYVLVENVAALLSRGIDRVLGDLASLGYDAEWSVISACGMGAPHTRERVFILAYPSSLMGEIGLGNGAAGKGTIQSRDDCPDESYWKLEPFTGIRGMVDGVSNRVDRLRALGNAVVPQIAELIGREIKETL